MTGYGYGQVTKESGSFTVEIRAVNHRYLDVSPKLSKKLLFLEESLNKEVKERIIRGHLDIYLEYKNAMPGRVVIDESILDCYRKGIAAIGAIIGCKEEPPSSYYAGLPEVMRIEPAEDNQESVHALFAEALAQALDSVIIMREREGMKLREDILTYCASIEETVKAIAGLAPSVPEKYRQRLLNRLKELKADQIDPARIAQEIGIIADRCAVDEEIARLHSHIHQIRTIADREGACGKQLDFIVQEMNREMNTIGSKASDEGITNLVIHGKSLIEKLREQVQNVE